jgi:aryl-alcohol dehydrogenase-like predicted oxidoreductase
LQWPSSVFRNNTYLKGLALTFQAGLTWAVGVSNFDIREMQQGQNILSNLGIPLASNQVVYHLLNRKIERSGLLDHCQETGVRLIAYSPLAQGLLTGKYSTETPPPGPRRRQYASLLKDLPGLISLLAEIGKGHGEKTPGQVALNWGIYKGGLPIPGAKTEEQVKQNVGAIGWRLTPEEN